MFVLDEQLDKLCMHAKHQLPQHVVWVGVHADAVLVPCRMRKYGTHAFGKHASDSSVMSLGARALSPMAAGDTCVGALSC